MDDEVEEFLEHFGVKGQKWGVRRNPRTGIRPAAQTLNRSKFGDLSRANVNRHNRKVTKYGRSGTKLTPQQRRARAERNRKRTNTAVKVIIGAYAAAIIINALTAPTSSGRSQGPKFSNNSKPRTKSVSDIINAQRDIKINALKKTHAEGHIDKDQLDNFISVMNRRYDKKIREAVG